MYEHQKTLVEGKIIRITRPFQPDEVHAFATEEEAIGRAKIVNEAMTWIGTPFQDCADIKGPNGAVDCAMLLVRVFVDTGKLAPFDPRPYPQRWHLHHSEERFLGWIEDKLGAKLVNEARIGDVLVYQWGRCFAHGAILVNSEEVIHAYGFAGMVIVSRRDEALLKFSSLGIKYGTWNRPVRFYDVWSA